MVASQGRPAIYELPNDAAALKEAKRILDDRPIEIWLGTRNVGRLEPVAP
jgi:hypothetical protein